MINQKPNRAIDKPRFKILILLFFRFLPLLLLLLLLLLLAAVSIVVDQSLTVQQAIRGNLSGTKISSIKKTAVAGLYQIIAGRNVFYSDAKGHYLVFGHLYDLKTQTDLTEQVQASLVPKPHVEWNKLPKGGAIVAGRSNLKLVAVIDPDCPYCRKLEQDLMPLTTLKATSKNKRSILEVHYYLIPLTTIHPQSLYHSSQIWCSPNRLKALQSVINGEELSLKPTCDLKALAAMQRFFRENHFDYTPTLIREDGAVKFGYADKEQVLSWIDEQRGKTKSVKQLSGAIQ